MYHQSATTDVVPSLVDLLLLSLAEWIKQYGFTDIVPSRVNLLVLQEAGFTPQSVLLFYQVGSTLHPEFFD